MLFSSYRYRHHLCFIGLFAIAPLLLKLVPLVLDDTITLTSKYIVQPKQEQKQPRRRLEEEINILDWFQDTNEEVVTPLSLKIENITNVYIPKYLVGGSFIQNGPARWRTSTNDYYYGLLFDGVARFTKYKFVNEFTVEFSSRFLLSNVYDSLRENDEIYPAMQVGPVMEKFASGDDKPYSGGIFWILRVLYNTMMFYDNCVVNLWDYDPFHIEDKNDLWAITYSSKTAKIDSQTLETTQRGTQPPSAAVILPSFWWLPSFLQYEIMSTAHPEYCKKGTGDTYNVNVVLTVTGFTLSLVKESHGFTKRNVIATLENFDDDSSIFQFTTSHPFIHSFGLTATRALILLQPVRMKWTNFAAIRELLRVGLLRASTLVADTKLWVVDLESGESTLLTIPDGPIYFWHTVSAIDHDDDDGKYSSLRVIGYEKPDAVNGDYLPIRMDYSSTSEQRNMIPQPGNICEIKTDMNTVSVQWYTFQSNMNYNTNIPPGIELPTHRYSRSAESWNIQNYNQHPRYIYGVAPMVDGANFDKHGVMKVDTVSNVTMNVDGKQRLVLQTIVHREPSQYYSEPTFVPDPNGVAEDAGVLLSHVLDGIQRQSYLLILNASSMEPIQKIYSGSRNTYNFHGAFFT